MDPQSGPLALKRAIRTARMRSEISSDEKLAEAAGISPGTLANWFAGRTIPRSNELAKVAKVLRLPLSSLEAAYDGRSTEPAAMDDLVAALRTQAEAISELVERLDVLVGPMGEALATLLSEQVREATRRPGSGEASSSGR